MKFPMAFARIAHNPATQTLKVAAVACPGQGYVRQRGGRIGRKSETPDISNQGTDPTKRGCPFDVLLEVGTRLLMMEVKVQRGPRQFQYLGDEEQLRNLRLLWDAGVKVYYSFNIPDPCPNFANDFDRYPEDRFELVLVDIAALQPHAMDRYLRDGIPGIEAKNLLALINRADQTLPEAMSRWPFDQDRFHSTTFLIIAYNLDQGLVAQIPTFHYSVALLEILRRRCEGVVRNKNRVDELRQVLGIARVHVGSP